MIPARRLVGDSRIKAVLPASPIQNARMQKHVTQGIDLLAKYYSVELSDLAGNVLADDVIADEVRAAELNEALRSRDNDAIIAVRGGYGCLRLLPQIDFESCKTHPKLLIGYSDLTILQIAMFQKAGVPSLSGPMLLSLSEKSMEYLQPLLTTDSTGHDLIPAASKKKITILQPGQAEGILLGGNLFSLVQMIGTGFLPRLDNAIFFFEDINETIDHIDSFLSHLKLVGQFFSITGVIIGDISWRHDKLLSTKRENQELLLRRLNGMFRKEIPVIAGVDYGHVDDTITMPIGVKAVLDTDALSLTLAESVTHG